MGWGTNIHVKRNSQAVGFVDKSLGRAPQKSDDIVKRKSKRRDLDDFRFQYVKRVAPKEEQKEQEEEEEELVRIDVPLALTLFMFSIAVIFMFRIPK